MDYGNLGEPQIDFTLTDDGATKFGDAKHAQQHRASHGNYFGRRTCIPRQILQPRLKPAAAKSPAHYTIEEAQEAWRTSCKIRCARRSSIVYSSDVDPTLGKDSIRSGISSASIYAVIFVSLFMLAYYWIAGITANVALVTNIIILLGVMCSIGTTLTLPGIAGVVLTIGMAVDANVLIYERLREELPRANRCAARLTPVTPARSGRFSIRTSRR
jgi:protein-export membrane protein SecD